MSDFVHEEDKQNDAGWIVDPFHGAKHDVPLGDVTGVPRSCVEIANDWVPLILTALDRLKMGDMWNGTDADIQRAYQNIETLQAELMAGVCEGGTFDYECENLPLFAPNIDFHPNHPYDSPDFVPTGYACPPWNIVTVPDTPTGFRVGDVAINPLCALFGFPPVIPISGVPRFQIHVEGPADVDIEFMDVFQGGIAIIYVDSVPHSWHDLQLFNVADIVNVAALSDLVGIAIDALIKPVEQDQISITESGPHIIEVQFFPRPALDLTLGWGGGIRAIQICSSEVQVDLTQFVTDVRLNDGVLEKEIDGSWIAAEAVTDHVDASVLVRGNGCSIEGLRAWDANWFTLPDTDFVDRQTSCDFLSTVVVDSDESSFRGLRFGNDVVINHSGGSAALYSTINKQAMIVNFTDKNAVRVRANGQIDAVDDYTHNPTDEALLNVSNAESGKVPLLVQQRGGVQTVLVQVRNQSGTDVVEVSDTGWLSAMQQLIVNDLTSTAAKRAQGRLLGQWVDDTDSIRKGAIELQVDDFIGARTAIRAEANGNETELGFHGTAPVVQPVITTDIVDMEDMERLILDALGDNGLINWDWTTVPGGVLWSYLHTHYDPKEGLNTWAAVSPNFCGSYLTGFGWQNDYDCEGSNSILRITFDPGLSVTYNEIRYKINVIDNDTFPITVRLEDDTEFVMKQDSITAGDTGFYEFTWTGTRGFRNVALRLTSATNDAVFRVVEVQISGTITRPNIEVGYILQ